MKLYKFPRYITGRKVTRIYLEIDDQSSIYQAFIKALKVRALYSELQCSQPVTYIDRSIYIDSARGP
jgi:hypothetical protein